MYICISRCSCIVVIYIYINRFDYPQAQKAERRMLSGSFLVFIIQVAVSQTTLRVALGL